MVRANRLVFGVTASKAEMLRVQRGRCFYCDGEITTKSATRDHLFPRASGRQLNLNKVLACRKCNCRKGCRQPTDDEVNRARDLYALMGIPRWEIG
jgi:5-methylcytosine-specific restriction endonuclease McrA